MTPPMMHPATTTATKIDATYTYGSQNIPYQIWLSPGSSAIDTIVFLGTVQIGNITRWVAAACPPGVAAVQGGPHWFAKPDGSDIPEYMYQFTLGAFTSILREQPTSKRLRIIGESQSVPCVLRLFRQKQYGARLACLVLLQPLGFNAKAFGGTASERIKTFKRRIAQNARYHILPIMVDARLRYNYRLISRQVDLHSPITNAQYNSGLAYDGVNDLQAILAAGHKVRIVCGANDTIIRPGEVQATLAAHGIRIAVETVRGIPHSSLATRAGQKLLHAALQ